MKTKSSKTIKVLIALDYDPTAQKIAEIGFSLAKAMGAEIILLHVLVDLFYYFVPYLDMGSLQLESTDKLKNISKQFLDKTKQHLGDETIQTIVKEGDFAGTIISTANEMHVDIIVMGSHSRKWLENIVMGSVTEKVLHQAQIPLLIIPTKKHH